MRDTVRYRLPLGWLGGLLGGWFVDRDVKKIFEFRASRIRSLLLTEQNPEGPEGLEECPA